MLSITMQYSSNLAPLMDMCMYTHMHMRASMHTNYTGHLKYTLTIKTAIGSTARAAQNHSPVYACVLVCARKSTVRGLSRAPQTIVPK